MASWDRGLTEEQREIASFTGAHVRLLAGPGTGKTFLMTRRVIWLLTDKRTSPEDILVLTFTRAAAYEIRVSIEEGMADTGIDPPRVSTLHSFSLRQILLNEGLVTKLPVPLRVADDFEENTIIREELKLILGKSLQEVKQLFTRLASDWQRLSADKSGWEKGFPDPRFIGAWKEHRRIYGYTLRSELTYRLKQLIEERGDDVDMEGPPKQVLVDEYQDLNPCDLHIIRHLARNGSEIYCAGDDDQSIYGFRLAAPAGIRNFPREYTPSKSYTLEICHRCGENILEYALEVARQDHLREEKRIEAKLTNSKGVVELLRFTNQNREAKGIVSLCSWLMESEGVSPEEILVLLRSDKNLIFSKPIKDELTRAGFDVATVTDPCEPLDFEDGRKMLCLIRLATGRNDHLAWRTLLSGARGIGPTALLAIYDFARRSDCDYTTALLEIEKSPDVVEKFGSRISKEVKAIRSQVSQLGLPSNKNEMDSWIMNLATQTIRDDDERRGIIELLLRVNNLCDCESIEDLLRNLNTSLDKNEQDREPGKINVMTMHQAKGLSADAVIVAGVEQERIPGRNNVDEERRLLYVSLTRARKYLFVTFCNKRLAPQRYYGISSGKLKTHLTEFLCDGRLKPKDGEIYCADLARTPAPREEDP